MKVGKTFCYLIFGMFVVKIIMGGIKIRDNELIFLALFYEYDVEFRIVLPL